MPVSTSSPRYHFRLLQTGSLPLRPSGHAEFDLEHRCTSVLIWPAGEPATADNVLVTDPSFTESGFAEARRVAGEVGLDLERDGLALAFLTHEHFDHLVWMPGSAAGPWPRLVADEVLAATDGMDVVACPGHSEDMRALVFLDERGRRVWIVGDAVLDREWLLAWGYFWPNGYSPAEIAETWRSVARALSADVIVPGHGEPIEVTGELIQALREGWARAEHGELCPEVGRVLEERAREIRDVEGTSDRG